MSELNNKYDIAYKSLKEGRHHFNYEIDDEFFEEYGGPDEGEGKLEAHVTFEKTSVNMALSFEINGHLTLPCDRCLEEMHLPIWLKRDIALKQSSEEENDEHTVTVSSEAENYNIAHLIYEFIMLNIPIRRVHPEKEDGGNNCNNEMAELIEEFSQSDRNNEDTTDPRWDQLRKLIN